MRQPSFFRKLREPDGAGGGAPAAPPGSSSLFAPPAPTAPSAGDPPPAPPPAPPTPDAWFSSITDPETKTWAEKQAGSRGWKGAEDGLKHARELDRLFGGEKIPVPKAGDKVALEIAWKALGRPDDPKAYELPSDAADRAKLYHENGLTKDQVAALENSRNTATAASEAARLDKITQQSALDRAALEKEWGEAFVPKLDAANRAAKALGLDSKDLDLIAEHLGGKKLMTLLADAGVKYQEAPLLGIGGGSAMPLTPSDAAAQLSALWADKAFTKQYREGNADARAKVDRLQRFAVAGK